MRIVAISDQHGLLPDIPETDVLVIAGDVTPVSINGRSVSGRMKQRAWVQEAFLPWLSKAPATDIAMTWGNHDFFDGYSINNLPSNVHVLQNTGCTLHGVQFYGVPQTPRFYDWAFNVDDDERGLGHIWRAVPESTDVLISHGPPYMACDKVASGEHVGSKTMAAWLLEDRPRPSLVLCGHIHECGGTWSRVGQSSIVNVSLVDVHYRLAREPFELIRWEDSLSVRV